MHVEHPLVKEGALNLRRYQETVIARAVEENTLVVLPTGLGKTIVAAMVAAHRLHKYPKSKVLLVAPTKPLALQHKKTFDELLKADETVVLTGSAPAKERRKMWDESEIIFATPQTIENDVIRGLDLSDVSLLVFDEAHRAVGDYSYVALAKEYLQKSAYPLILGLTASPSSEKEKVDEVCSNLNIRYIEAKTEADKDVKEYMKDVKVNWVKVELPKEFKNIQKLLQDVLRQEIGKLKELGYIESANMSKINKRILLAVQADVRKGIKEGDAEAYAGASVAAAAIKVNHAVELLETQGINALDEYLKRLRKQNSKAVKRLMHNHKHMKAMTLVHELKGKGTEHPKLDKLADIVKKYKGKKVLVFTQYRDSVDAIIDRLNQEDILAHEFIGQAKKGTKKGMNQKEQVQVIERFKHGAYTALVATSVAEEGLDIPRVDAVVFYEPVPSEIRSIQRRGRTGRGETGEVYVLMAAGTRDEAYYWVSVHKERRMKNIVKDLRKKGDPEKEAGFGQQSLVTFTREEGDKLKIIVDTRERNSTILSALRQACDIDLKQLPVGDYLVSERVCIERKTMGDFLQSIVDKRLLAQAREMRRNFEIPIMILEGVDQLYIQRNIHPNAVRGAIACLAVDYDTPIIPSEDEEDTAQLLIALAKREQEDNKRPVALRGEKKPELLHERQRFIVESLPNVSAVTAKKLLEHFKSVQAIMCATHKQLTEVEGVGDKKAKEIRKVTKTPYK